MEIVPESRKQRLGDGTILTLNGRWYWVGWESYELKKGPRAGQTEHKLSVVQADPIPHPEKPLTIVGWRRSFGGARIGSTDTQEMLHLADVIRAVPPRGETRKEPTPTQEKLDGGVST